MPNIDVLDRRRTITIPDLEAFFGRTGNRADQTIMVDQTWTIYQICTRRGIHRRHHSAYSRQRFRDGHLIARILRHLGLCEQPPDPPEGKSKAPADGPVVMEDFDDGWPGYEEPVLVYR